ncbi:MAG: DALR domain-containing protein [Baekduia sp.]
MGSSPRGTTASRWRTRASGSTTRPGAWSGSATPGACESPEELAGYRDAFFDALADDFNTPRALAAMADWIREANRAGGPVGDSHLREMLGVLGLENLLRAGEGAPAEVVELAERRATARASRDFAESDRLRDELRARGWEVRDGPAGQELVPIGP